MLKNMKLRNKIMVLCGLLLISFIGLIGGYIIPSMNRIIEVRTEEKMQNLVETSYSILQGYYDRYRKGEMTEEQAKEAAKNVIRGLKYGSDGYFWINDYGHRMVMHPESTDLEGKDMTDYKDPNGFQIFVASVDVVKSKGEGVVKYEWEKPGKDEPQPKISYVKGFELWQWVIGSGIYVDDLEAMKASLRDKVIGITGALSVAALLMILAIILPLNKDLGKITAYIKRIADYDFSQAIDIRQKDELGSISLAINHMVHDLKALVTEIKHTEDSTYSTLKIIDKALEEMGTGSEQTAMTVSELAKGAMEQASSAEKGSEMLNGIISRLAQISSDIGHAEKLTQKAKATVSKGESSMQYQTVKMEENRQAADKAARAVALLSRKSDEIGQILTTISGIAEQTNLLALNAAIEAARAGEMGKGFAVVANEVRKLAEQSGIAVQKISGLINEVQVSISHAVTEMNKTEDIVNEQEQALQETVKAFADISETVTVIASNTKSISEAATSLNANATQAGEAISEIASISEETAAGTEEVSATVEEQTTVLQSISQSTKDLSDMAHRMRESIEKFVI